MNTYEPVQWILFFYLYCFIGWIWECTVVSIPKKKFVNRGFMKGPLLPIYGSGAIVMLVVGLPLKGNYVALFFAGMAAATLLEYVTGAVMEALFKVRYWDYSDKPFNVHGYICLTSSLCWGVLSVFLVEVFQEPLEPLVLGLPDKTAYTIALVISMLAAADFATSFKTAIDLRDVLLRAGRLKAEAARMQKRIEVLEAVIADEKAKRRDQTAEELQELKTSLLSRRERSQEFMLKKDIFRMLRRNPSAMSVKYKESFIELKDSLRRRMSKIKEELKVKTGE